LTIIAGIIFWRLALGTIDKQSYNETTFILQFSIWWGYAACLLGGVAFIIVSAYTVWRSLNEKLSAGEQQMMEVH